MAGKEGGRGRPRSESARVAILSATRDLLRETGYENLTIVAVAARAGTGKQTVYRWWQTKSDLVTECVLSGMTELALVKAEASGDAVTDIADWLSRSYAWLADPNHAPLVQALTAASASDPAAAKQLSERFATPLREALDAVLSAGIETGTVRADVDAASVSDLLLGALIFDTLSRDAGAQERVPAVVSVLLDGIRQR